MNGVAYKAGDFVYIADKIAIQRRNAAASEQPELSDCWIAIILEVRAVDKDHVYAHIYWMHTWKDQPELAQSALKNVDFDKSSELTASNHSKNPYLKRRCKQSEALSLHSRYHGRAKHGKLRTENSRTIGIQPAER